MKTVFFKKYPFKEGVRGEKNEKIFAELVDSYGVSSEDIDIFKKSLEKALAFVNKMGGGLKKFLESNKVNLVLFSKQSSVIFTNGRLGALVPEKESVNGFNCYETKLPFNYQEIGKFSVARSVSSGQREVDLELAKIFDYDGTSGSKWLFLFMPAYELYSRMIPHYALDGFFLYTEFGYAMTLVHELAHLFYNYSNSQRGWLVLNFDKLVDQTAEGIEIPLEHDYLGELFAYLYGYEFCRLEGGEVAAKEYLAIGKKRIEIFLKNVEKEGTIRNIYFHAKFYPKSLKEYNFARLLAPIVLKRYPNGWERKLLGLGLSS